MGGGDTAGTDDDAGIIDVVGTDDDVRAVDVGGIGVGGGDARQDSAAAASVGGDWRASRPSGDPAFVVPPQAHFSLKDSDMRGYFLSGR